MKIFDIEKSKTMKLLGTNMSQVAITTDMWTSNNQIRDSWQSLHISLMNCGSCKVESL
ncbi:hypothetical protein Ancab_033688, partial [Ancistrocladus abbreviatus]